MTTITDRAGLGCMGMSGAYGPSDEAESIATIREALDGGITLLDTGDFYGMGHNELLIARALDGRDRAAVRLSVKFGAQRGPDGAWLGYDARPAAVKTAAAYSLNRLRADHIDVYRPARLDSQVPIEAAIPPTCRELGIAVTAYGVLSRGLLSDSFQPGRTPAPGDVRGRFPRFNAENAAHNAGLVH